LAQQFFSQAEMPPMPQSYLDCVNQCLGEAGLPLVVTGLLFNACSFAAGLAGVTGGTLLTPVSAAPAGLLALASCIALNFGVPVGIVLRCLARCPQLTLPPPGQQPGPIGQLVPTFLPPTTPGTTIPMLLPGLQGFPVPSALPPGFIGPRLPPFLVPTLSGAATPTNMGGM
jgi:hypothetical protein